MNQYLIMYQPHGMNEWFPALKTWAEILTILIKKEEVGGSIRVYRLDKSDPERLLIGHVNGAFWLEDLYGNGVEG